MLAFLNKDTPGSSPRLVTENRNAVPGWARWRWEWWELWTDPVVAPVKGDQAARRPGPGSYIHPSQLKPSPAASLQD